MIRICFNRILIILILTFQFFDINCQISLDNSGRFNLPMQVVILKTLTYSHSLNGILIGDSVLNFNDWQFIDPQTDHFFDKGKPCIQNSTIIIGKLIPLKKGQILNGDDFKFLELIRFNINQKGKISVIYHYPGMSLSRKEANRNPDKEKFFRIYW